MLNYLPVHNDLVDERFVLEPFSLGIGNEIEVRFDPENNDVWLTQANIAQLFDRDRSIITRHLKSALDEGELDEESNVHFLHIAFSDRPTTIYNLDAVIAVGLRIKSPLGLEFRKWARKRLRELLTQGYSINPVRLENDPEALRALAAAIREIRLSERNQYKAVLDIFKASSSDYDADSQVKRTFFATVQDKFHYAVTKKTAAQLRKSRVNASKPHCGVLTFAGKEPTVDEALVAKNLLEEDELRNLQNLCEQWMLYTESKAMRGQKMTMGELLQRVNQLLEFNGFPVMWEYPAGSNAKGAENHVKAQMAAYRAKTTIGGLADRVLGRRKESE